MHGWDVGGAGHGDDDEEGPRTEVVECTNCETERAIDGDCSGCGVGGGVELGMKEEGSGRGVERAAAGVGEEGRCRNCSRE